MYVNSALPSLGFVVYLAIWIIIFAAVNLIIYKVVKRKIKEKNTGRIVIILSVAFSVAILAGISGILFLTTISYIDVEPLPPQTPYMDLMVLNTSKSGGAILLVTGGRVDWEKCSIGIEPNSDPHLPVDIVISDKNAMFSILLSDYKNETFIKAVECYPCTGYTCSFGTGDRLVITNISATVGETLFIKLVYPLTNGTIWEGRITLTE